MSVQPADNPEGWDVASMLDARLADVHARVVRRGVIHRGDRIRKA